MERKFIAIMLTIILVLVLILGVRLFIGTLYQQGDIIEFGGTTWLVLDSSRNRMLVISEYTLVSRAYHNKEIDITWADSDIRRWLNDDFYNSFTDEERSRIVETQVTNNDNPWFYGLGGQDTTDKIFLLSLEEVLLHFSGSGRIPEPGVSGEEQSGIYNRFDDSLVTTDLSGEFSWWWLRSPGVVDSFAMLVVDNFPLTGVSVSGAPVDSDMFGVRPAMWIYR